MKYLFIERLNAYLTECGKSDVINNEIDTHSIIALEFNTISPINIDLSGENIILWASFGPYSEMDLKRLSFDLFQFSITNPSALYPIGQPMLYVDNDELVLSAVLPEEALRDQVIFKQSMEYFYERAHMLYNIINN